MTLRSLGSKLKPSTRVKLTLPAKVAAPFYQSAEWLALVAALMVSRFGGRERAHCEDPACKYPARRGVRLFADHIVELRDGGPALDPRNVLFRCGSCHTRKTAAVRALRRG